MHLNDVLDVCRALAPEDTALPGDPVGLLIGTDSPRPVTTLAVCLDATSGVVGQAAAAGAELVIAHHPLIYAPLKALLPDTDAVSQSVALLVKNDMALYAMHTNWDRAAGGINDTLAHLLGLQSIAPLGTDGEHALPRIGDLPEPVTLGQFQTTVGLVLRCSGQNALRGNAVDRQQHISRVAVCGGAGAGMAGAVRAAGADVYVTSDVRHHEWWYAEAQGLALVDAGHEATEAPGMEALVTLLRERLPGVKVFWCG